MQLNHLDLQLSDVQAFAQLLIAHFGFERLTNDKSAALVVLRDEAGFTLVLQKRKDAQRYPEDFHIGFIRPTAREVREQHARLAGAGFPLSPVDVNARGTRFYFNALDQVLIEVSSPERS